jgi:hypothetical protein
MNLNYSVYTKKFFTYIINSCLLMDKSYYKNDDIKYNSKYFTDIIPLKNKIKILYGFDYQNSINGNKNLENIYIKTKYLINMLLKYLIILETNKNKTNFKNTDKEIELFNNELLKINKNKNLEIILFNFYYELDSYMNFINFLVEIILKNNLYLNENIDIKETKINLIEKNIKKYYLKNLNKLEKNNNYNIEELKNIYYTEPYLITKELIETIVLYDNYQII